MSEGCGDDPESGRKVRSTRDAGGKGMDVRSAVLRPPTGPSDAGQEASSTSRTDESPPKGFRDRRNGKNQIQDSPSSMSPWT